IQVRGVLKHRRRRVDLGSVRRLKRYDSVRRELGAPDMNGCEAAVSDLIWRYGTHGEWNDLRVEHIGGRGRGNVLDEQVVSSGLCGGDSQLLIGLRAALKASIELARRRNRILADVQLNRTARGDAVQRDE